MKQNQILWKVYYKNTFTKIYRQICELQKQYSKSQSVDNNRLHELCSTYIECHDVSVNLMQYYMSYNGFFHYESSEIIKVAFAMDIINDGETWIDTDSLCFVQKKQPNAIFEKKILSYYDLPYFDIFTDLDKFFKDKLNGI